MSNRYCKFVGCPGGDGCKNDHRGNGPCVYEYDPKYYKPEHQWQGEGPPPRRWTALDGTIIYRSYADYCD